MVVVVCVDGFASKMKMMETMAEQEQEQEQVEQEEPESRVARHGYALMCN